MCKFLLFICDGCRQILNCRRLQNFSCVIVFESLSCKLNLNCSFSKLCKCSPFLHRHLSQLLPVQSIRVGSSGWDNWSKLNPPEMTRQGEGDMWAEMPLRPRSGSVLRRRHASASWSEESRDHAGTRCLQGGTALQGRSTRKVFDRTKSIGGYTNMYNVQQYQVTNVT